MCTEAEARRAAEEFFGAPVRLHPFALGWVAWNPAEAEPGGTDRTGIPRPPNTIGGTAAVVDARTGVLHPRPLLDPPTVARLYTEDHG
jgi:hypothetical protein